MNDRKVLIVEDEPDTLFILNKLLSKNNFDVKTAINGKEALKIIPEFQPQVILADWNMPIMNGIELCEEVKSNNKYKLVYFIILTARSSLQDRVKGLDIGADDFLLKPIENQELIARIKTGIRIFTLQNELRKIEHGKALLEMACTIGHKINNPLSSLLVSLKNVQEEVEKFKGADVKEDFEVIESSIARIQALAKDLVNLKDPEMVSYTDNKRMINLDNKPF